MWHEARHTVDSRVLGPHLETLAIEWVIRYAPAEAGLRAGATGRAIVACGEHRTNHEIDVLALDRGVRPRTAGATIAFLGEAKSRDRRAGIAELRRLEHVRDLLGGAGYDASTAALGLFSATGFSEELRAEAGRSGDPVLLVGLDRLYAV